MLKHGRNILSLKYSLVLLCLGSQYLCGCVCTALACQISDIYLRLMSMELMFESVLNSLRSIYIAPSVYGLKYNGVLI